MSGSGAKGAAATAEALAENASDEAATAERIALKAEVESAVGRALDPQRHESDDARMIASELCNALTDVYADHGSVRPETLAIAVQTVLETLLSGIEREGVDTVAMRVALANSLLSNGGAEVSIDIAPTEAPARVTRGDATLH